jgi:hypothetical protein
MSAPMPRAIPMKGCGAKVTGFTCSHKFPHEYWYDGASVVALQFLAINHRLLLSRRA